MKQLNKSRSPELQPFDTLSYILLHPLARRHPIASLMRFAQWQIVSRIQDEVSVKWIDGAVLGAKRGMTGATGNIYCGIHEFPEMAFLLHLLRSGDLFIDIGANIGSYTVLASKVCGARTVAVEPDPKTALSLRRNIILNAIEDKVSVEQVALGSAHGEVAFTVGLDTMNRVANDLDQELQVVPMKRLDDIPGVATTVFVKLDVEGFEEEVIQGGMTLLSSPSLLAIQCESHGPKLTQILNSYEFKEYFYNPYSRLLSLNPCGYRTSNALFVRDEPTVAQRVKAAPSRKVFESTI